MMKRVDKKKLDDSSKKENETKKGMKSSKKENDRKRTPSESKEAPSSKKNIKSSKTEDKKAIQFEETEDKKTRDSDRRKVSSSHRDTKDREFNTKKTISDKKITNKKRGSVEFDLSDADDMEKDLILHGTVTDRLNCLALLCTRNPTETNYKQLLQFCENQRNDVIYLTLKLIRDLIKENIPESTYIQARIIKSFEAGARNQYIKDKVVEIIGVLCRAGIFSEAFVHLLISRLIEKGKTLELVQNALKSVISSHESLILSGIEDFYYKNDSFRFQHGILKFVQELEFTNRKTIFKFYDEALTTLDEYSKEQKEQMVELLVNGLSRTVSTGDKVTCIEMIRDYYKSPRSIISVMNLLMKTSDPSIESYVLKVSRTTLLRNTKQECSFLNMIYNLKNGELFIKLVDNSFYSSVQTILALMLMAQEKKADPTKMYCLHVFINHYNPVVRDLAGKILRKEKIGEFDPFDKVYVEGMCRALCQQ